MRQLCPYTDGSPGAAAVKARLVAVVRDGVLSSLGKEIEVTSEAVMEHMAQRLSFVDPGFSMEVFTDSQLQVDTAPSSDLLLYGLRLECAPCRREVLPAQPCIALYTGVIHTFWHAAPRPQSSAHQCLILALEAFLCWGAGARRAAELPGQLRGVRHSGGRGRTRGGCS